MSRVRVVTDSTAQLDPDLVQELEIIVLPLEISFGSQKFREGVDLSLDEFFRRVAHSPALPVATAPTMEAFRQVYADLNQTTDQILSLHVASQLNETCRNAREISL